MSAVAIETAAIRVLQAIDEIEAGRIGMASHLLERAAEALCGEAPGAQAAYDAECIRDR
jgi:hypothetical protein